MCDLPTMQVGTLELCKTPEGWQYLSKGEQSEPDSWCDAASVLGPFSNSGVGGLLDELLAARELATLRAEAACRHCAYWTSEGHCGFIDTLPGERVAGTTGCRIIVTVHDDSGLYTELKTAPNFSCPNFSASPSLTGPAVSFR